MKKSPIRKEVWKKPPEGKLLINVDVSFRPENGSGSTDAVIRDSSGSFIAASHSYFEHVVDAPSAELMAVKDGLLLARHIGCNRIIIQSDCLEVVETVQQGGFLAAAGAPIYDECNHLWQEFQSISIEHCDRESNQVAHVLAREAISLKLSCI
jgi:ribonuclease HI